MDYRGLSRLSRSGINHQSYYAHHNWQPQTYRLLHSRLDSPPKDYIVKIHYEIPLVDPRIRLLRDVLLQEFAQWPPSIFWTVLQESVRGYDRTDMSVVVREALAEFIAILWIARGPDRKDRLDNGKVMVYEFLRFHASLTRWEIST